MRDYAAEDIVIGVIASLGVLVLIVVFVPAGLPPAVGAHAAALTRERIDRYARSQAGPLRPQEYNSGR